jgi:hypothetical protein
MMFKKNRPFPNIWVALFFVIYGALALLVIKDYGVSADEMTQRAIGQTSLYYVAHVLNWGFLLGSTPRLSNPESLFLVLRDRDYGVAFEFPAELLIRIFDISDSSAYLFRHYLTFIIFFIAVYFFYRLARDRFKSVSWGLLGTLLLVLSPRFFGDSFFNNKDIVFASFYIIGTYTLVQLLVRPTIAKAALHALACALAIDTRIVGVVLPAITVATFLAYSFSQNQLNLRRLGVLSLYLILLALLVIGFWPWLWANPVEHFFTAFKNMAHFRHGADMVFFGDIISARNLPWYYIPVWISITTPIFYLVLMGLGLGALTLNIWRTRVWAPLSWSLVQDSLFAMLSLGPLFAVIVLHSILYNGWRQMYFIYAPLLLIALLGCKTLWDFSAPHRYLRYGIAALLIVSLSHTGYWMIRYHPHQYLYFNILAGKFAQRFDIDYGGASYQALLEKILRQDSTKTYSVFPLYHLWQINYFVGSQGLKPQYYRRLINDQTEACSDYIITIVRGNRQQYSQKPEFEIFDELVIDGQTVYTTFKRRVRLYEEFVPALGKTIDFSSPHTRCFLPNGWADSTENWGVWSTGTGSTLRLQLPEVMPKELYVDVRAFVNQQAPTQRVDVSVDGRLMKSQVLNNFESNRIVIPIPQQEKTKEWIDITFALPNARSPKSLGMGEDTRVLGLGLKSAVFQ